MSIFRVVGRVLGLWSCILVVLAAPALAQTVSFVDGSGAAASTFLDNTEARVRVTDPSADTSSSTWETVSVTLSSTLAGDSETLTLAETDRDSGVFEGTIRLLRGGSPPSVPGVLETAVASVPRDTLTATYGTATDTATMDALRIRFLDEDGRPAAGYTEGDWVHVQVEIHIGNNNLNQYDSMDSQIFVSATNDYEFVTLHETGNTTGVFEGRVRAVLHGTGSQNGLVGGSPGNQITAQVFEPGTSTARTAQAPLVSNRVYILSNEGQPVDFVAEASAIRLRVVDRLAGSPSTVDSLGVEVISLLSLDDEDVYLQETGADTGVFEGRIWTSTGSKVVGNGTLEVTQDPGPPQHQFDTIQLFAGSNTDQVQTYGSDTRFVDAWGGDVAIYAAGSKAYIRVEAPNRNQDPNRIDFAQVTAESLATDDSETLSLAETGRNSGVFAGSVPLGPPSTGSWNDGTLQAPVDELIQVRHHDALGPTFSADSARLRYTSLQFVEEDGEPTQVLVENGSARLRALSSGANTSPTQVNQITAQLDSRDGQDQETVTLTETGPNTGVFTAEVQLDWTEPGAAVQDNGVLETSNGGTPRFLPDLVTAAAQDVTATATTAGARLRFLDVEGRETGTYAVGETAWVRLEDHNRDTNSDMQQTITVVLFVPGEYEQEMIQLTETGLATGIFEGGILTADTSARSPYNGTLEADSGSRIRVEHVHRQDPNEATAEVILIQNTVQFEDADGQPVDEYLRGTAVRVRLYYAEGNLSPGTIDSAQVLLAVQHTGDLETVSLTETGPDTGVFTGSRPLRFLPYGSAASENNGLVETGVYYGETSYQPDSVTVTHVIWNGPTATDVVSIGTDRIRFVDAAGFDAEAYSVNSRVYVRVEEHGTGQPGVADSLSVMVRSGEGADEEAVQLQETGPATGLYEGSIATSNLYSTIYNGVLTAEAGWNVDIFTERSSDRARIVESVLQFIDGQGRPTAELLEGGVARIRSTENPNFVGGSVTVTVRSRDGGDEETVELTSVSPGVYEGEIQMDFLNIGLPPSQDGVLQTSNSGPEYEGDEVTADITYHQHVAKARAVTVGSRISFVDAAGQEISAFALGDTVRVRVEEHNHDDPSYAWTIQVNLYGPDGEQEDLLLTETGLDTNIYEASVPSRRPANGPYPGNGWLEVEAGDAVDASYSNENRPHLQVVRATVLGGSVAFVDGAGQPVQTYLQGSRAWLRVMDVGANLAPSVVDSVTVALGADISTDSEDLVLTETGPDTGLFLGSIDLELGSPANDGILQSSQQTSPPYAFDVLRATYASGTGAAATASAGLTGSRTWFVDADGNPVDSYARGTAAYVRVEDQVANRPALRDTVQATLESLTTGDNETLVLLEMDSASGIFQGSLPLAVASTSTPADGDGKLHAEAGEQIKATHQDGFVPTQSSALAEIRYASVTFIDESGRSTGQALEGGQARVRVVDVMATTVNSIYVRVRSSRGVDQEFITVNQTAPGSGVFEGAVQLEFISSGGGISGNGTLETGNSGSPDYSGDTLTADYQNAEATAVTVPSRIQFLDRFGRVVSTFAVGDLVGLRLESHNDGDPATRQTAYVTVRVPQTSETENVALLETGFGTNVYEGAIPSGLTYPSSGNGTLETQDTAAIIEAEHSGLTTPNPTRAQAAFTNASISFVDADGQPVASYLESSRAYIRVFDAQAGTAPIGATVRTDVSQDQELVMLDPVAPGVFVGSIALSSGGGGPVAQGNGTVETGQLDTLRATYQTWQGAAATATAGLASSRAWFVDAYGNPTETYARGTRAHVRVENHNLDQPGVYNTAQVTVRSLSTGDVETLSLLETARDGGLFAGSIALETLQTYPQTPTPGDGKLQSDAPEDIEVVHTDGTGGSSSSDRANIQYGAVMFVGEDGEPTAEVVEGGMARIRAFETYPYRGSTVTVRAKSRYGTDQEFVTLTETPPQSGIYEGTVQLGFVSPGGGVGNNSLLETSNSGNPAYLGDELTLDYQDSLAYAVTIASRVQFIDAFGRETASFAIGEPVRVRVESHSYPDPTQRQTSSATVRVPATGESESVTLIETGFDTNVYEGSIPTSGSPAGRLDVQPGDVIRAEHYSFTTPNIRFAEAVIAGASVLFVDEAGEPAEIYLESTRALVRVSDFNANQSSSPDTVSVTVRSVLGEDQENLTLTETGGMTGVFEGWIGLGTGPIAPSNGTVETQQDLGSPHEFDSLWVTYMSITGPVTDTVGTISSRTAFVDAYGSPADSYARGTRAYVRVEDHNQDQPGVYNTVQVTVRSLSTGDVETLSLLETAREGGLFAGSIALEMVATYPPAPVPGDGKLLSEAPEDIEVVHTDWSGETSSSDRANIQYGAVTFIGEDGEPTAEVVEGGVARIRAIETYPYRGSTVTVRAKSRYGADQEFVTLTETPPQSGIYEGTVQLGFVSPGGGVGNNSLLETSNSGNPAYLGDELTLDYQDSFAYAVTISSRVQFIDAFGRETASFAVGEPVRVRVENHNFPDPSQRQTTSVTVSVPATGATSYTSLLETGFDTNVYEGSVPTHVDPSAGTLQVQPGDVIRAEHYSFTTPNIKFAEAVISGASVLFVDEAGQPAEIYLESTRAIVRVSDFYANQSSSPDVLNVIVRSVLGGDQESVTLTETGPATRVFEGSIGLGTGPIAPGNGTVETRQDVGSPHEFDSLRATYSSVAGLVTDTVGTISSRTAFVDAYGNPADAYARGTRAYVQVEDHNLDQPGVYNTAQVTVRSLSTGDVETLSLLETAREGGLFAGSIVLEMMATFPQTPTPGDGKLQSEAPEDIEVVHTDWTGETSSSDRANIQYGAVMFIDESGALTAEVVEGGMARIRAIETYAYRGSTVTVRAKSRYGADQEFVTLTETPPQSGVYEGTVQLGFVPPGSGLSSNNVLETSNSGDPAYLGDELTVDYQDSFGYAVTIASRVQFIDAFGRETASFAVGEPVRVRVENYGYRDPAQRQTISSEVRVPATGESEWVQLFETDFDTNVYEGAIASNAGSPAAGTLQVQPGDRIRAEHYAFISANVPFTEAVISGASVLFVDESGEPAEVYLESSRAFVRVSDSYANQSSSPDVLNVTVRSVLGGDQENLTLTETGGMTGVFEGSIGLGTGAIAQGNGTVETRQDVGSPHEFDSLRVSYMSITGPVTDTVGTISSRTAFVDAYGNPADSYARSTRAYVRVVDHNLDQPGVYNTAQVTVRSLSTGDVETLSLLETAREGGLFAGSIALETLQSYPQTPTPGDGKLQSEAGEDIEVVHTDWTGETSSSDRASIQYGAVMFVDESGKPTTEVMQQGVARIRAIETSYYRGSTVTVRARSRYGADQEFVTLTETPPQSGVYEGTVQLAFVPPGSATANNSVLETSSSSNAPDLGDELTLDYQDSEGYGVTIASRVQFIDEFGRETSTFAAGEPVRVRVENYGFRDPVQRQTTPAEVTVPATGESEFVQLLETGFDTNVYEGSILSSATSAAGTLDVQPGDVIRASHYTFGAPSIKFAEAVILGASVLFVDESGQPAETYLESTRALVRVSDAFANQSSSADFVSVTVRSVLGEDQETVYLTETGGMTGVFEGEIPMGTGPVFQGNQTLETEQDLGTPHEFDSLRVSYQSVDGPVTDTVGTISSRTAFVDTYGNPAETYARGSRAYVRVEDHNVGPNTTQVTLRSLSTGDEETITIPETSLNGVFAGSIALETLQSYPQTPTPGDGKLQSDAPEDIEVVHTDWTGETSSSDRARIQYGAVMFVDESGTLTAEVVEGGVARIRAIETSPWRGSTVTVRAKSRYGADQEFVTLTETPPQSGVYEGTVQLNSVSPGSGYSGNDVLETSTSGIPAYLGDELTLEYQDAMGYGVVVPSRITFLDIRGEATDEYALRSPVRVRVESHTTSGTTTVVLTTPHDTEALALTETGAGTGLFEGTLPSSDIIPGTAQDGVLQLIARNVVVAEHNGVQARVTFTNNVAPVAVDDSAETEQQPVTIAVLANDSDPEAGPLQVSATTQGANGAVVINPDQTVTYAPVAAFIGTDTFTYLASDGQGGEARATVTVNVIHSNGPPTPAADSATTPEDQAVNIAVLANDTDPDNDVLAVAGVGAPGQGTAVLETDGTITYTPPANWSGETTFPYMVEDTEGLTAEATVTVTVTPVNDPPVAMADSATVAEDGSVTVAVLANDSDVEGVVTVASATQGTKGAVVVNGDNTVTYTPAANVSGADSFTYTIEDAEGATATATVSVTITSGNDAPVAVDDTATTDEDTAVNIAVLANDSDPENDTLDVTSVTVFMNGVAVLNADETVTFTPTANFSGTASFDYTMSDGNGGTETATVTITVNAVNDAPVADNDAATVAEDSSVTVTVLTNDTDVENDTLEVTAITQGVHGTVTINPDDTVTYTPVVNYNGSDSFTYTVSDGTDADTATVTVTVTSTNDAPNANDDAASVAEDGSVAVIVLGNDTDTDNDTLNVTAVAQGTNGAVTINPDKTVTYTPAANFNGTDSFTYTVSDGNDTDTTTVTVTVTSVNDTPNANDDTASAVEDGSVAVTVLGNDTDADDDTLTVIAVTQGTSGAVVINPDNTITYTPAGNFFGPDAFTYTVSDGNGGTDTATVTVTVAPSNDALTASDDTASVDEDASVTVAVLSNDSDPENDVLSVESVTQGTNGAVVINPDKTVTYTPNANFNGTDSFTYTANDGNGGTDSATVTVTVTSVNDEPVAGDDTASVVEDGEVSVTVLGNDADADNDLLDVTAVTQGNNGSVVVNGDNTVTYTPAANYNGTDSFTYTINDGNGGTDTATVTVTVGAANDAPNANDDSGSTSEDAPVTVSVLGNDSDPENDSLSVASVTQGTNGGVVINSGQTVTYTPGANFHGTDSFTYTLSDGNGGTDTATVTVTITSVNDAPVADDDAASAPEDGSVTVTVKANDTDADNDTLDVTSVTQGTNGSVVLNADDTVTYTPGANLNGSDSFTYTVIDGNGGTDTATVTVSVGAANDAPNANDDTATVAEDGTANVTVLTNDSDLDNDTLTVTSVTQGTKGSVVRNADNTVTYTPNANANGSDSFTYTIGDGNGGSDTATVAVTITPVNDAPVAVNDAASTLAEVPVTIQVRTNDTDIDSPTLTVTAVTQGAHGSVAVNAGQTVTYTPATAWVGPDTFTYTISDSSGGTATATVSVNVQAPARVSGNIQVLYTFNEGSGTTVTDVSGVGTPLNLTIGSSSAVTWLPGALSIDTNTLVKSASTATKVINASKASNEVTMEAWVVPANLSQTGPAAIVTLSQNATKRNVTLGQSGTLYNGQLRTSTTSQAGTQLNTGAVASLNLSHVVYTRSSTGAVRIYVNGTQVASSTLTGNLSGWSNYELALGGEASGTRYWLGDLHLVAIYSRALTATEVRTNFLAGAN